MRTARPVPVSARSLAADDDRRAAGLDRFRERGRVGDDVVLAVERVRLALRRAPQTGDDRELLLEPVEPGAEVGNGMPYAVCSASYQPAPSPSSTRPPDIWSTPATVMASGPGSRNVADVTSVPRRMLDVSLASPASVVHASLGPGRPVTSAHLEVVVAAEEGAEPEPFRGRRHAEDVVVRRALLWLDEDAQVREVHRASVWPGRQLPATPRAAVVTIGRHASISCRYRAAGAAALILLPLVAGVAGAEVATAATPSTVSCTAPSGPASFDGGRRRVPRRDPRAAGRHPPGPAGSCRLLVAGHRSAIGARQRPSARPHGHVGSGVGARVPHGARVRLHACRSCRTSTSGRRDRPPTWPSSPSMRRGKRASSAIAAPTSSSTSSAGSVPAGHRSRSSRHGVRSTRASPSLRPPGVTGAPSVGQFVEIPRDMLGVPDEADAVVVNLTVTQATGYGYLTAFPCGDDPPEHVERQLQRRRRSGQHLDHGARPARFAVRAAVGVECSRRRRRQRLVRRHDRDPLRGTHATHRRFAQRTRRVDRHVRPRRDPDLNPEAHLPAGSRVAVLGVVSTVSSTAGFITVQPCGGQAEVSNLNFVGGGRHHEPGRRAAR